MRFGTGTYNVRASEGLNPETLLRPASGTPGGSLQRCITCTVAMLDGTEQQFLIPRRAHGSELLERVFVHLELIERDFFGLQFITVVDARESPQKKWLEPHKSVRKQMICPPYNLYFRVRFYVSDPGRLVEEYTRYHFFLQLRKDILDGRLPVPPDILVLLASYAVQSEFGDYNLEDHGPNYLAGLRMAPDQPADFAERVSALHEQHRGQCPADAEFHFLSQARRLELYGVELFEAKSDDNIRISIGVNACGMVIFHAGRKINEVPWTWIMKISFKRKQFYVTIRATNTNGIEHESLLVFHVATAAGCKALWKACIEHHTFFRLIAPPMPPPKTLFSIGSRYRYSGRTEFQTMEEVRRRARVDHAFHRSNSRNGNGTGSTGRHTFAASGSVPAPGAATRSSETSSRNYTTSDTDSPDLSARLISGGRGRPSAASSSWARRLLFASSNGASSVPERLFRPPPHSASLAANPCTATEAEEGDAAADAEVRRLSLHKSHSLPTGGCEQEQQQQEEEDDESFSESSAPSLRRNLQIEYSVDEDEYDMLGTQACTSTAQPPLHHNVRSTPVLNGVRKTVAAINSTGNYYASSNGSSTAGGAASSNGYRDTNGGSATTNGHHHPHHRGLNGDGGHSGASTSTGFTASTNGAPVTRVAIVNGSNGSGGGGSGSSGSSSYRNSAASPRLSAIFHSGPSVVQTAPGTTAAKFAPTTAEIASSPRSSVASYTSHVSGYGSSSTSTASGHSPNGATQPLRRSPQSQKSNSPVGEDSVVVVRMKPDAQGRFGFNVKGGADQNYPVIVSRVAPGSSADKCYPRLNEGDQVLLINGRDVSTLQHDQVVSFIRSARQKPGELVLTIRPNVYRLAGGDLDDVDASAASAAGGLAAPAPPPLESSRVSDSVPRSDRLAHSLRMIEDALASGRCNTQFEALYRKKAGMTMNDCRLPANVNKNRYRDVCPYDATRVLLARTPGGGDYINASFVNMEIPSSGIVNRYIACQGPLQQTSGDFWFMVWEHLCTTIVMLTTTVERGRVKCHQYWPRLYESSEYGGRLVVTCIKERETKDCVYREFAIKDRTTGEERRVSQMQYVSWPDHGVPDDPAQFIDFVSEVRKARAGSVDPIVVHCSAGIGRTGVLILMETAACLVEANEPVYPIDIVRTMRDQRAMLIQTPGQYIFVCESILRAFNDGVIKPLAEYHKIR